MNIFRHELRAFGRTTLTWMLSLIGIVAFFLMVYPSYAAEADNLKKAFAGFPPALLQALHIDVELLFSVVGFYGFIFTYIMLCGSIQAMILGTTLFAKEFNRKTADFLFTKPASRTGIFIQKILAGIFLILATDALVIGAAYVAASAVSTAEVAEKPFFMISFSLFFVQMMFYMLGIVIAVIKQRLKPVLGVSLGTVFGFFVIGMLGSVLRDEKVSYIVPFHYYDPIKIIREPVYETKYAVINIVFVVAAVLASYLLYIKKDIRSV